MSESPSLTRNVRVVSLCTLLSRVLGLVRDAAMGALFGNGPVLDAFTVAFRIPNLARVLLGEGVLATAFLPTFLAEQRERGWEAALRLASALFWVLGWLLAFLVLVAELVLFVAIDPWVTSDAARLLRDLTAIMLPYVILICTAAQLAAILQGLGRFALPALLPVILNLVWLVGLGVIAATTTDRSRQIYLVTAVVVGAGVLQWLAPWPLLWRLGFRFRGGWVTAWGPLRGMARRMVPILIGLSITQLNTLVDSLIAWGMTRPAGGPATIPWLYNWEYPLAPGTASALYLGQRLYQFPLGVFGVALGTVLYPQMTRHAQEHRWDRLREDLSLGIRLVLAVGVPATLGLMLTADPLARLLFQHGQFDAAGARLTGQAIQAYGLGVWAACGLLILQRAFYAVGDRMTPMWIGFGSLVINLALNVTVIWPLGGYGLALATSFAAMLQCLVTAWALQFRTNGLDWRAIGGSIGKLAICSAAMVAACYVLQVALGNVEWPLLRLWRVMVPIAAAVVIYLAAAKAIGYREPWMLLSRGRS